MLASKIRTYVVAMVVAGSMSLKVLGEICGCASSLCCSEYGYCGAGNAYCGHGCRQGPCYRTPAPGRGGVNVSKVVTQEFFDSILNQAGNYCEGKRFYTRAAFLSALSSYSQFGKTGSSDDSKKEIAAFFAHATHETGHFCNIEEINGPSIDYCDNSNIQYPCAPGKKYHGRGPLQLAWNFNYGAAGKSIGFDGINNPDIVGKDPVISFKTALWFWMNNVRPVVNQGFGATIRALNGAIECNGGYPGTVQPRIKYYRDYCNRFGVAPENNLISC